MSFFKLPKYMVAEVYLNWLELKDVAVLDTSVCNHNHRVALLSVISNDHIIWDGLSEFGTTEYFEWLVLREIVVRDLHVCDFAFEGEVEPIMLPIPLPILLNLLRRMKRIRKLTMFKCSELITVINSVNGCVESLFIDNDGGVITELLNGDLVQIIKMIVDLKHLEVQYCGHITDDVCNDIIKYCPNLQSFNFDCCDGMTLAIYTPILAQGCKKLTSIILNTWTMNEESVLKSLQACHYLTNISFGNIRSFSVECVTETLRVAPQLQSLTLWSSTVDRTLLNSILMKCNHVTVLSMACCNVSDSTLQCIAKHCVKITDLNIGSPLITDTGICAIAKSLHLLRNITIL